MKIEEILDEALLSDHIEKGFVNCTKHPTLPLHILNYSQKAQFAPLWDEVTCLTRGLITHESGAIVARGFRKFFNIGHNGRPETELSHLPETRPEVTEKMDGSLGILWHYDTELGIATRGSFNSDQATWATKWYQENLSHAVWPEGYTPLFEIIYADNRIVVDYEWEGLILLSLVNSDTGFELRYFDVKDWAARNGCKCVQLYDMNIEEARNSGRTNFEGFVLTWHNPYIKVKVKLDEYCRLHRIMTGFSPIALWEHMRFGWPLDEIKASVKDTEFLQWINLHESLMREQVKLVNDNFDAMWAKRPTELPDDKRLARKKLAEYASQKGNKCFAGLFFTRLDGHEYQDDIWKDVRPDGAHPFKRDLG